MGVWHTVFAMLRQIFNDIFKKKKKKKKKKDETLSTETSDFFKQILVLKSFNSLLVIFFLCRLQI